MAFVQIYESLLELLSLYKCTRSHFCHSTHIFPSEETVVPTFTPAFPPAVLYDPKRLVSLSTVANDEHSVIEGRR
jgi:hypothetical protein